MEEEQAAPSFPTALGQSPLQDLFLSVLHSPQDIPVLPLSYHITKVFPPHVTGTSTSTCLHPCCHPLRTADPQKSLLLEEVIQPLMDTWESRKADARSTRMAELSATLIFCIFSQCHTCLTSQTQDSRYDRSMPAGDKVCLALQKLDSSDHHLGGR